MKKPFVWKTMGKLTPAQRLRDEKARYEREVAETSRLADLAMLAITPPRKRNTHKS